MSYMDHIWEWYCLFWLKSSKMRPKKGCLIPSKDPTGNWPGGLFPPPQMPFRATQGICIKSCSWTCFKDFGICQTHKSTVVHLALTWKTSESAMFWAFVAVFRGKFDGKLAATCFPDGSSSGIWKLESAFNGFQRIAGRWWHILSLNAARGHVVGGDRIWVLPRLCCLDFLLNVYCNGSDSTHLNCLHGFGFKSS